MSFLKVLLTRFLYNKKSKVYHNKLSQKPIAFINDNVVLCCHGGANIFYSDYDIVIRFRRDIMAV